MYSIELTIREGNRIRILKGKVNTDTLKRFRILYGSDNVVMVLN